MPSPTDTDVAVIGAGVIGAAVARAHARRGRSVWVLERHARPAQETSSRNSGVVHAGLYYRPGSLKAQLCLEGAARLAEYCAARGVGFARVGKVVAAVGAAQEEALAALEANALASGATGLQRWSQAQVRAAFPSSPATAGLFSGSTGIVDAVGLVRALLEDAEAAGATFAASADVTEVEWTGDAVRLETTRGPLRARQVVNAAGLGSARVAALAGVEAPALHFCRGDYFRWAKPPAPFPHLLYPVRPRGAAGLGVHVTVDLAGGVRLGPDAEFVDDALDLRPRDDKRAAFASAAETLVGPLSPDALSWDGCGMRPKLSGPGGGDADFHLARPRPWWVQLSGIESPGLTAALALAERVVELGP